MKRAFVVIGANYGDEGKGLMTDALCEYHMADLVIRFNGGAQAGHTISTPGGKRHVFGHFGSGSFLGIPTYLGPHFVTNPLLFMKEHDKLTEIHEPPTVFIDEGCMVTTPYDILVNQLLEEKRGSKRHGSVGVGFGETIGRHAKSPLMFRDLNHPNRLINLIKDIRYKWFPRRCMELGLDPKRSLEIMDNDDIMRNFFIDALAMMERSYMCNRTILRTSHIGVFEGAQGLALDMDRGQFPYVTRSNTGMVNAAELLESADVKDVETVYTTRTYLTRHGAGPLRRELPTKPYAGVVDDTNLPHDFQGELRFAYLDVDDLRDRIHRDIDQCRYNMKTRLGITCLDQIGEYGTIFKHNSSYQFDPEGLVDAVNMFVDLDMDPIRSYGRTRTSVVIPK